MNVLTFVSLALATWRVASLLAEEDGPGGIFANLRHAMGDRWDEYSNPYTEFLGDKWYHKLLYHITEQMVCIWCSTIWIGTLWLIAWLIWDGTFYLSIPFALSAVAVYLNARGVRFRKRTS